MSSWNDMPTEIIDMIVKRANSKTRNALRSCSSLCKELVDNASKISYCVEIGCFWLHGNVNNPVYYILISTFHQPDLVDSKIDEVYGSKSFEEIQKIVFRVLQILPCIKKFTIELKASSPPLNLIMKRGQPRILAESVFLTIESRDVLGNILSQIEPIYLSEICIRSDNGNADIYDMPQIIHTNSLRCFEVSCIREDQLLKLNACEVHLNVSNCKIKNYLMKCRFEAPSKMPKFTFYGADFPSLGFPTVHSDIGFPLPTAHSQIKLEIGFKKRTVNDVVVKGCMHYDSERYASAHLRRGYSSFRVVENLTVSLGDDCRWLITIRRRFYCQKPYTFGTFEEFQRKLDEIMEHTDLINSLIIEFKGSREKLTWKPRRKELIIRRLAAYGDNSVTSVKDLLLLVDSNFPMDVTIGHNTELVNSIIIYDLPQIRNASSVYIENPFLLDDQLMRLNCQNLNCANTSLYDYDWINCIYGASNTLLTAAAVNQFIKKSLLNLDKKERTFKLGKLSIYLEEAEILEDLEIIEFLESPTEKQWVISSANPEYAMAVKINFQGAVSVCGRARHAFTPGMFYHIF